MLVIFQVVKVSQLIFSEARWMSAIAAKLWGHLADQPLCG